MRCLTARVKANELSRAEDAYVRKFGVEPPEFPDGLIRCGTDQLAKLYRMAISRNQPLQNSEIGKQIQILRGEYAKRFAVEPVSCGIWYGFGSSGPVSQLRLLEKALADGSRRLLLETVDFGGFEQPFLNDLENEEFLDVRLDDTGHPIPPDRFLFNV